MSKTSAELSKICQGPSASKDVILIASGARPVGEVRVDGERGTFFVDTPQRVVHGKVRLGFDPVHIEVFDSTANRGKLPERPVPGLEIPIR